MTGVIVRRLQAIMRKPVRMFGRCVAPNPAVAEFFNVFTRDRMTVLVVTAFFVVPGMSSSGAIEQHHPPARKGASASVTLKAARP